MNPKSAEALVGAALLSIVVGMLILSPHGSLFFYGLAAVSAAFPAIFGSKRLRVVSAFVLIGSLALAANVYPEYAKYLDRIKAKSSTSLPSPFSRQQERQ